MAAPLNEGLARQNHVFVDYENVHEVDVSLFNRRSISLTLLLGVRQKSLEAALVEVLLTHANAVQLVRMELEGRNAVDFALAYYLGRAVLADPLGYFHIVSKDTGFDPLVKHLQSRQIQVYRHNDFSSLTATKPSQPAAAVAEEPWEKVLGHLEKNPANRPRTKQTLTRFVQSHCKGLTDAQVAELVETLRNQQRLFIADTGRITYHL